MTRLVFVLLAACGSAAELGAPNPPPEWPMGTDLHHPTPAPAPREGVGAFPVLHHPPPQKGTTHVRQGQD